MSAEPFTAGDRVTSKGAGWAGLVLVVASCVDGYVKAEHRWTMPESRAPNGVLIRAARDVADKINGPAECFAAYNPRSIPVMAPVAAPYISQVRILESRYDSAIPADEMEAARAADRQHYAAVNARDIAQRVAAE